MYIYLKPHLAQNRARFVVQLLRAENHEEAVSAQPLKAQMTEGRASLFRIVIFDLPAAYRLAPWPDFGNRIS